MLDSLLFQHLVTEAPCVETLLTWLSSQETLMLCPPFRLRLVVTHQAPLGVSVLFPQMQSARLGDIQRAGNQCAEATHNDFWSLCALHVDNLDSCMHLHDA